MSALVTPFNNMDYFIQIQAWMCNSKFIHYEVWCEITYPFLNFNGVTVEF